MPVSPVTRKRWFISAFCLLTLAVTGFMFAQTMRPSFYPDPSPQQQQYIPDTIQLPPQQPDLSYPGPGGYYPDTQPYPAYPSGQGASGIPLPGLPLTGGGTDIMSYVIALSQRYDLIPALLLIAVGFLFRFVWTSHTAAIQREQFMQTQLNQSSDRFNNEQMQSSMKLNELDGNVRSLYEQTRQQGELIHLSGQVSRDLVNIMTEHNAVVVETLNELAESIEQLNQNLKKVSRK